MRINTIPLTDLILSKSIFLSWFHSSDICKRVNKIHTFQKHPDLSEIECAVLTLEHHNISRSFFFSLKDENCY